MEQDFPFSLVQLAEDGELRASTESIAIGYGQAHKGVIAMTRKYLTELETLGQVDFQKRPDYQGSFVTFAMLNQAQSLFLLTLLRNTEKVVSFKLALTHEFVTMAERLRNRDMTMWNRRLQLEVKDKSSFAKGQAGSRLMLTRRTEKPGFTKEHAVSELEMNQRLFS